MTWFLEQLAKQWSLIKAAPIPFAIAILLIFALVFLGLNYWYKERLEGKDDIISNYKEKLGLSPIAGVGPNLTVSENTLTPTHSIHHVGGGVIRNITVPDGFKSGTIYLIPDEIFTTDTSGNIRNSLAASPGQVVRLPMMARNGVCFSHPLLKLEIPFQRHGNLKP